MDILQSIIQKLKKYNPISFWLRREKRYGEHLEKVWGMPEGELERQHKERMKKIADWAKGIFK